MAKIQIINPIPVNNSSANALLTQGLQGLKTAFNPLQESLKTATDNSTQRLTGLAKQYVNTNDPNDPDFQRGLQALRSRGGLGQINEDLVADAIFNRKSQIPAIQASNLSNELNSKYAEAERVLGLEKDQAIINNYNFEQDKYKQAQIEAERTAVQKIQEEAQFQNIVQNISNPNLTVDELMKGISTLPLDKQKYALDAYYSTRDNAIEYQQKLNELTNNSNNAGTSGKKSEGINVILDANSSINSNNTNTSSNTGKASKFTELLWRGESDNGDYNIANAPKAGGGYRVREDINLENLTVGEILELQKRRELFAVGAYQAVPVTLQEAVEKGAIDINAKFNKETQDLFYTDYLAGSKRPQINGYFEGENTLEAAALAAAREWAAFAGTDNKTVHKDGINKASVSYKELTESLKEAKQTYQSLIQQGYPPKEAHRIALLGNALSSNNNNNRTAGIPTENVGSYKDAVEPNIITRDTSREIGRKPQDIVEATQTLVNPASTANTPEIPILPLANNSNSNVTESTNILNEEAQKLNNAFSGFSYPYTDNYNRTLEPNALQQPNQEENVTVSINRLLNDIKSNPAQITAEQGQQIENGTLSTDPSILSKQAEEILKREVENAIVDPNSIELAPTSQVLPPEMQQALKVQEANKRTQNNIAQLEQSNPSIGLLTGSALPSASLFNEAERQEIDTVLNRMGIPKEEFQVMPPSEQTKIIKIAQDSYRNKLEVANSYERDREQFALTDKELQLYLSNINEESIQKELGLSEEDFEGKRKVGTNYAVKTLRNSIATDGLYESNNQVFNSNNTGDKLFTPDELGKIIKQTGILYERYYNTDWSKNNGITTIFSNFANSTSSEDMLPTLLEEAIKDVMSETKYSIEDKINKPYKATDTLQDQAIINLLKGTN